MRRRFAAVWMGAVALAAFLGATNPAAARAACPNEAIRAEQQWAAGLPDCRAYEQVSPVAKNGYSVNLLDPQNSGFRALDGGRLQYTATGAFPGAAASLYMSSYIGTRGAGWGYRGISVPELTHVGIRTSNDIAVSDDLSHSLVFSSMALTPEAVEGNYNLYVEDNATGAVELIGSYEEEIPLIRGEFLAGGTPDFDHVIFNEKNALTPDAPDNGESKLYEFSDGELRLVSILPGGAPATAGVFLRLLARPYLGRLISEDGSRVFFNLGQPSTCPNGEPGCAGLYVREGDQTIPISVSQRTGEVGELKDGAFRDASPDGSVVYFTSRAALTDESWGGSREGLYGSLYRYDLDTGELLDLSVGQGAAPVDPQVSAGGSFPSLAPLASGDGSTVVFTAGGKLTPDAVQGNDNLYVWHRGQLSLAATAPEFFGSLYKSPKRWISPNGMHVVLEAAGSVMGEQSTCPSDGDNIRPAGPCIQIYEYDVADEQLSCVSCPQSASIGNAHAIIGMEGRNSITDDGRVFFQTAASLVGADSNGQRDVYEWKDGVQSLLSTGQATSPTNLLDASPDGEDVYITTSQQLVAQDTDALGDAYDVRVGGGIAAQMHAAETSSCAGEECLPPASAPKAPPAMTSAQFHGPASKPVRKAHHKKKARKKKHAGKKRHAAKRGKKAQRHARHDQRSGK